MKMQKILTNDVLKDVHSGIADVSDILYGVMDDLSIETADPLDAPEKVDCAITKLEILRLNIKVLREFIERKENGS